MDIDLLAQRHRSGQRSGQGVIGPGCRSSGQGVRSRILEDSAPDTFSSFSAEAILLVTGREKGGRIEGRTSGDRSRFLMDSVRGTLRFTSVTPRRAETP